MKRLLRPFHHLQWKLTFSYVWITVVTLLIIELILSYIGLQIAVRSFPQSPVDTMGQEASQAALYLSPPPPDRAGLLNFLKVQNGVPSSSPGGDYATLVADRQGIVLAAIGVSIAPIGTSLFHHLSPGARAAVQAALAGRTDARRLVSQEADGTSISSVPIRGRDQQVVGALVEKSWPVNQWTILGLSGALVLIVSIPVIILASIIGAIFGFLIARGLTKRIQRLFFAADNWSRGNFSVFVSDKSGDELGQLAQRLNNMAEQLQNLLQTSQKFAKLEERNRLSRDLHDSIKQQAFSIAMQVRAAKGLLVSDALEAQEHLHEAEQLVHLMQQELTALIYELRPTALENMQFAAALRELVAVWTRQTGILVSMQIEDERRLPSSLEDALFRVTQESLANVARHSKATTVQIVLLCKQDAVDLFISDNGQGFAASINTRSGIGLLSIHERIEQLGGLIDVKSQPGHGTSIAIHCKYDAAALPAQGV